MVGKDMTNTPKQPECDLTFFLCEKCGKRLIQRRNDGLWVFMFGKREGEPPPVYMEIYGSIRMKCLRRSCSHVNVLSYFPFTTFANRPLSENSDIQPGA